MCVASWIPSPPDFSLETVPLCARHFVFVFWALVDALKDMGMMV